MTSCITGLILNFLEDDFKIEHAYLDQGHNIRIGLIGESANDPQLWGYVLELNYHNKEGLIYIIIRGDTQPFHLAWLTSTESVAHIIGQYQAFKRNFLQIHECLARISEEERKSDI
jgi:hypothetical protein